jgi:hypothetical protein
MLKICAASTGFLNQQPADARILTFPIGSVQDFVTLNLEKDHPTGKLPGQPDEPAWPKIPSQSTRLFGRSAMHALRPLPAFLPDL